MEPALLFLFLNRHLFEVLGFENLTAVQALDVVHTVAPGDYLGSVVLTSGLHKARLCI